MSIRVASCTAQNLLKGNAIQAKDDEGNDCDIQGQLTIPEYQRPVVWGEPQLRLLLNGLRDHRDDPKSRSTPYFLGSVILHADQKGKLNLIDGQQRITALALMAYKTGELDKCGLKYSHPSSQNCIKRNLDWLATQYDHDIKKLVDLDQIEFSLVVTDSLDDAYLFFETQNTGGVRLEGTDIIKAYHLRAIKDQENQQQFAKQWEQMEASDENKDTKEIHSLRKVVLALLRGRAWQGTSKRDLPSYHQPVKVRQAIVSEFAENTERGGDDLFYGLTVRKDDPSDTTNPPPHTTRYALDQPLNAGINSINYLSYFRGLYQSYWVSPELPANLGYESFIKWLRSLEGCDYLHDLYVSCLLLYISRFGEADLVGAAHTMFRVVYSKRMTNQMAVREASIYAFIIKHPVLDWITQSYTSTQCFAHFNKFELIPDHRNLESNSVKRRFFEATIKYFKIEIALPSDEEGCRKFASKLDKAIELGSRR